MPAPPLHAPAPSAGKHRRRLAWGLGLALVFVGLPILLLEYGNRTPLRGYALATLFFLWGVGFVVLALRRRRRQGGGALAFNAGIVFLALAAVETVAGRQLRPPLRYARHPAAGSYTRLDALLGYMPVPGSVSRFTTMDGDEQVSDVTYTIDEEGHRIQAPRPATAVRGSVLCFGCSLTYGSGVADDETWPWRLEEELGGALRVHNFAFNGYGPQQMLAALEGGRVAGTVAQPPRHAIFMTMHDHTRRVTGKGGYAVHEPRYVLRDDGSVERAGLYGDATSNVWRARVRRLVNHSNTVRLMTEATQPDQYDPDLYAAIVTAARDHIRRAWPDCTFHVVIWRIAPEVDAALSAALEDRGLDVWMATDLIPGLEDDPAAFQVHRRDPHPNAHAHRTLAKAIAARLSPP